VNTILLLNTSGNPPAAIQKIYGLNLEKEKLN
jgi:hypothetical protein